MSLLHSAQGLLEAAAALARGRVELFGLELQEELNRFFFSVVGALVVLLLGALAAAFAAAALVLALPEAYRALAAACMAAGFVAAGLLAAWSLRRFTRARPRALATTLAELDRDREALRAAFQPVATGVARADRVVGGMRSVLGWAVQLAPVLALLRRK